VLRRFGDKWVKRTGRVGEQGREESGMRREREREREMDERKVQWKDDKSSLGRGVYASCNGVKDRKHEGRYLSGLYSIFLSQGSLITQIQMERRFSHCHISSIHCQVNTSHRLPEHTE